MFNWYDKQPDTKIYLQYTVCQYKLNLKINIFGDKRMKMMEKVVPMSKNFMQLKWRQEHVEIETLRRKGIVDFMHCALIL